MSSAVIVVVMGEHHCVQRRQVAESEQRGKPAPGSGEVGRPDVIAPHGVGEEAMPVDLEPCIGVWRPEQYERYTERALAELPPLSPRLAELERFFYGSSHDIDLDAAGRIMVPSFLGEHAKLSKEVVVVGAGDRLELWDRTSWDEHRPALLGSVAEITARVDHPA